MLLTHQRKFYMKQYASKIITWLFFIMGSIACSIASYHYFPKAFPIIHLDITMNRSNAVKKALKISKQFFLGPTNAYTATSFATDEKFKTFVELEAGGKDALVTVMNKNLYHPYTWQVRLFKPFEQHEATIAFTPSGAPYEFKEKLSENTVGNNITTNSAQKIAETFLQSEPWNNKLTDYKLVESSQDTALSGRIDHTFVYERVKEKIGEGLYRLKIEVCGDHPSQLSHYVKEPEGFINRYQEMRSSNENIAYLGTLLMLILYGIGCSFFGLFYLIKSRLLILKVGLYWALGISAALSFTMINKLPLYWMKYNSSFSPTNFLLQLGVGVLYNLIFLTIVLGLVFVTAEGLTRAAFKNKIQFWKLFNPHVASSYAVLGYTVGAYLLIPYLLMYVISFYLFTTKNFGWWTPSSALFNPDVLATYFPWFESIALSLQAGFLEECLFRAVPLSCAALIGNRYGKRNWWIAGAFVLQIFIFGAAHANYPAQPAYARLVELIFFSSVFGGIYLRFGLLPAIISHFGYDVFLFALPLLVSSGPEALMNKIMVAALAFTPLWIIIIARIRNGSWHHITVDYLNEAWLAPKKAPQKQEQLIKQKHTTISPTLQYGLIVVGTMCLIGWGITTRFSPDNPRVSLSRSEAFAKSQAFAEKQNISFSDWKALTNPIISFEAASELNKQHRFVWQQEQAQYSKLIDSYLAAPHWIVRLAKFTGPLELRAEEHQLFYGPDGSLRRYFHKLPESAKGASLSKSEALKIAYEATNKKYGIPKNQLTEITARSEKQPNRLNWHITFKDNGINLKKGEARITLSIAGDKIIDSYRSVHVPEDWAKKEENKLLLATIIAKLSQLLIYLLAAAGTIYAFSKWRWFQSNISVRFLSVLIFIFLFELINAYPTIVFNFLSSQPFTDQLFRAFGISLIIVTLRALVLSLIVNFVTTVPQPYIIKKTPLLPLIGISLGALFACSDSVATYLIPRANPLWANLTALRFLSPINVTVNSIFLNYLTITAVALFGIISLNSVSIIKRNKIAGIFIFLLLGFVSGGLMYADNLTLFCITSIINFVFFYLSYYWILQWNYSMVPIATATYLLLGQLQEIIFNSFTHAALYHLIASAIIAATAFVWYKKLEIDA